MLTNNENLSGKQANICGFTRVYKAINIYIYIFE